MLANGQNDIDCSEECCNNPFADMYLSFPSTYNLCSEEVVSMNNKDSNGRFIKGNIPWMTGKKHSEKTRRKISDIVKGTKHPLYGKHHSEETKIKMSKSHRGKNHPLYGKHHSEETKKKISEANRGENHPLYGTHPSEETRKKLSESHKGRPGVNNGRIFSDDVKRKMSLAHKGKHSGSLNPMYGKVGWNKGKHLSDEVRLKISKNNLGKHHSPKSEFKKGNTLFVGEKNPAWRGGISFEPYCQKFNKELKEKIRERDERVCQLCGIKENGKKLDVHHVHYDKENCEPDLVALCRNCHVKINANREYWETFFMNLLKVRGLII
jgi:hypothetical protein